MIARRVTDLWEMSTCQGTSRALPGAWGVEHGP